MTRNKFVLMDTPGARCRLLKRHKTRVAQSIYWVICVVSQCGRIFYERFCIWCSKACIVCYTYPDDFKPLPLSQAYQIKVQALSSGMTATPTAHSLCTYGRREMQIYDPVYHGLSYLFALRLSNEIRHECRKRID